MRIGNLACSSEFAECASRNVAEPFAGARSESTCATANVIGARDVVQAAGLGDRTHNSRRRRRRSPLQVYGGRTAQSCKRGYLVPTTSPERPAHSSTREAQAWFQDRLTRLRYAGSHSGRSEWFTRRARQAAAPPSGLAHTAESFQGLEPWSRARAGEMPCYVLGLIGYSSIGID